MTKDITEDGMREVMVALMQLPPWWNIGMPAIKFLLDFYLKNIGSPFTGRNDGLATLAVLPLESSK